MAVLALWTALKPVSCVYLHSRLGCVDIERTAAFRSIKLAAELKLAWLRAVDHPAMVITCTYADRIEICPDVLSYRLLVYEIHRSSCYRSAFSERDLSLVCREILRAVHTESVAEDVSVALAVEVEICMVCEVDHCRSIRLRCICHAKLALICPLITYHSLHSSRISLLAILRVIKELDAAFMLAALPYLVLEALRTAMEVVRAAVYRKSVLLALKSELAEGNTVCISSRSLSHAWTVTEIAFRLSVSESHISEIAVLVRNNHRNDCSTDI